MIVHNVHVVPIKAGAVKRSYECKDDLSEKFMVLMILDMKKEQICHSNLYDMRTLIVTKLFVNT
jgi:hypothetical protein